NIWQRTRRWLTEPSHAARLWLGRPCVVAAWIGLLLAIFSPPGGSGLLRCWFEGATGVPCPGCGLTRSLSCAVLGMFLESFNYHPLGPVILVLFVLTAVQSLSPARSRSRLAECLRSRATLSNSLYLGFVAVFVGFGATRALLHFGANLSLGKM